MKILITGGAGFIGSTLADRLLKEGNKVIVIDNFNDYYDVKLKEQNVFPNLNDENYKLYRGDICDKAFLEKVFGENDIDVIVHLAALAGVRKSFDNPREYVKNNTGGTKIVAEAAVKSGIKKLVFASSSSVYGNCDAEKFTEDLKLTEPVSPYAETKLECERLLFEYSKSLKTVCLRFFTVYGPRQRPDLAIRKFAELMLKGEPIPVYGDGTAMRDYTYIDDIVSGICSAIDYDKTPYEIINLGGGNPVTLNDMIATLEKVLCRKAVKNILPMQKGDVYKTVCDITKASKLLNYKPQTDFKSGIEKFIEDLIS